MAFLGNLLRLILLVKNFIFKKLGNYYTLLLLKGNKINYGSGLVSNGIPKIKLFHNSKFVIGTYFRMNNGGQFNMIGRQQPCSFVILDYANLSIGDHVGMSSTAIFCSLRITIGNYVKFGGNTCIYDTDFHSLNYLDRKDTLLDKSNAKALEVKIGNNVFVGAHSTILKGVSIGDNSIIGACSLITRNIPSNQIWGGNPAKFIRNI